MYVLDHKLSKYQFKLRDKLLEYYLKYLSSFTGIKLTKNKQDKIQKVVSCFILNFYRSVCFEENTISIILDKSVYSRRLIYNGKDTNRKISYSYHRSFLSWLHTENYINLEVGGVLSYKLKNSSWVVNDTSTSSITFKNKLLALLDETDKDKKKLGTNKDVLVLRNKEGHSITYNLNKDLRSIITKMNEYNTLARANEVSINGNIHLDVQGKKVFNNSSFSQGGRLYLIGDNNLQSINKELRSQIKINDNDVVELDYSSLHPRMLAELDGHKLPKDFDPYGIYLEGYDAKVLRKISKLALLIMINSEAPTMKLAINRAAMALNKEIADMSPDGHTSIVDIWHSRGDIPTAYVDVKKIMELLIIQNNYMADYFFSGEGIRLQNLDSKIIDYVINKFTQRGEVIVPIHDSLIAPDYLKEELHDTMLEGYAYVLGSSFNCKIEEK